MNNRLLSLGQASFLVLSDRVNKPKSKEVRIDNTDELKPVTQYPKTPPAPDTLPYAKVPNDEGILFRDDVLFDGSLSDEEMILDDYDNNAENESLESTNHEGINDKPIVPKKKMMSFAKMIFSLHTPHPFRHDYMFITPDLQYRIITSHLNIGSINASSLSTIINKDDFISFMSVYKGAKGRWLYVLREPHRDELASEINQTLI
ncbi:hypothetical protein MFLAVUS_005304 [Mucor flavus]|uniref:Transposase n=1 Tax=Mucor flavus TaxID=439312 RepID=A0ABP9YYD1_9FUNG